MAVIERSQSLVEKIRQVVQDVQAYAWSDSEVLDCADRCLESLTTEQRMGGQEFELDRLILPVADFTSVQDGWIEYQLPESVLDVRRVEISRGTRYESYPLLEGGIQDMAPRGRGLVRGVPTWSWSRHGRPGFFSLIGEAGGYSEVVVWFVRRYPPMHYGVAAAGSNNQQVVFGATPTAGVVVARDDLYTGMQLEWTSGPLQGQLWTLQSFIGATLTGVPYRAPSGVPVPVDGETYELCVPLPPEHIELLVIKAAYYLAGRAGNDVLMSALSPQLQFLERLFVRSSNARSTGQPKRLYSSRS